MGLWCSYFYLVIILIVSAEERNSTIRYSERRGKALKISKKPCTDPNGRKGICTFKWDCINHNGTLMGTCVDGFIFGTCCQYDYDPLLHDDFQNNPFIFDDSNKIRDDERLETTKKTTTTTTTTTVPTAASRPAFTTQRPFITTRKPTTSTSASSLSGQLVTWTSIGPTRRPVPQRPIILSPFPFRPGTNFPSSQGGWPMGVAFPVDPFQMNRPLSPFRPPILIQSAQSNVANQIAPHPGTTSFTILSDSNVTPSSTKDEMTTISVPIPQWSTTSSVRPTSLRPLITSVSKTSTSPEITTIASLYSEGNLSTIGQTTSTTQKPIRNTSLDYRKDCGVRTIGPRGRIVGGQSAYFGRWPWQVLVKEAAWLGLYQKNKCGGVLISSKYAITAGHCQPGRFLSSLMVILGEHDLLTDYERLKPEMRRVKRMIVHRHYNPQNFDNDIALLELDPPVIFRPHIAPICLPAADEDFTGKTAYVTGWGK
ncbi:Serine proteinase stubble, partial [Stegodyphus mimosarum]